MTWLSNIPFLRLLIPLISGILFAIHLRVSFPGSSIYFALAGALLLAVYFRIQKRKLVFLIVGDIWLFAFGIQLVQVNNTQQTRTYYGNQLKGNSKVKLIAVIDELPEVKAKHVKLHLRMKKVYKEQSQEPVEGNLLTYVKKSKKSMSLKAGESIFLVARLQEIDAPRNPEEFDYRAYLFNRQIYHSAFIDSNDFVVIGVPAQISSVWQFALNCKAAIIERYKRIGLSKEAYSICSALVTGYDDDIEEATVQSFSHSGTLHVLSVSGLHTGLIYLLISFTFDFFDRKKQFRLIKLILVTVLLWVFALVSGLSAPVLRAVIMFNLLGFGKIYFGHHQKNQLNILFASAFILLVYNPYYISDVGFLLSYFALFGILFFEPLFSSLWKPKFKISVWIWKSVSVSFAATLSTLPLTLFYFKQFPYWFFIANLVVIPFTFVLLLLALLALAKLIWLSVCINYLVEGLLAFMHLFNNAEYAYADRINFNFSDALWVSLFIVFCTLGLSRRSYRFVATALFVLVFWNFSSLIQSILTRSEVQFVVYDIKHENAFALKNRNELIYFLSDSSQYHFKLKPHYISWLNPREKRYDFNSIIYGDKQILLLNKPFFWPKTELTAVNTLVVSNSFKLNETDFEKFRDLEQVIVDHSNNNKVVKDVEELCRKFGISFYNTNRQGAFLKNLE